MPLLRCLRPGCDVGAFFNASDYLLDPAMKTGRLQIIDNAVVARVLVDDAVLPTASNISIATRRKSTGCKARVVVLARFVCRLYSHSAEFHVRPFIRTASATRPT